MGIKILVNLRRNAIKRILKNLQLIEFTRLSKISIMIIYPDIIYQKIPIMAY